MRFKLHDNNTAHPIPILSLTVFHYLIVYFSVSRSIHSSTSLLCCLSAVRRVWELPSSPHPAGLEIRGEFTSSACK